MPASLRLISPDIWDSPHFDGKSIEVVALFAALIHLADKHGRYIADARRFHKKLFRDRDREYSLSEVEGFLQEIANAKDEEGLAPIRLFEHRGIRYLDIPKFLNHQHFSYIGRPQYPMHPDGPYTEQGQQAAIRHGETLPNGVRVFTPEPAEKPPARKPTKRGGAITTASPKGTRAKKRASIDYNAVMEWWNALAEKLGLSKIKALGDARRKRIRQRLTEADSPFADLELLAKKIESQPFLRGDNKNRWRMSFDALFDRKLMAQKALEGVYGAAEPKKDEGPGHYPRAPRADADGGPF